MTRQTTAATAGTHDAETRADAPTGPDQAAPDTGTGPGTDGPTGAVWQALVGNRGGMTVAQLAIAAGVSKNAVRKALSALETDGHATRTAGGRSGGKRAPDTWHAATPSTGEAAGTDTGTDEQADPAGDEPTGAPAPDPEATSESGAPETDTAAEPDDAETDTGETETRAATEPPEERLDAAAVEQARAALSDLGAAITAAVEALQSGDRTAAQAAAETIYSGSAKVRRLVRAAVTPRPRNGDGTGRARPGELRTKVAAHLDAHRGKEFSPNEIGKAIGHSAGAVSNALDRLVKDGVAILTSERPRRFTATAPAASEDAEAPASEEAADATATS